MVDLRHQETKGTPSIFHHYHEQDRLTIPPATQLELCPLRHYHHRCHRCTPTMTRVLALLLRTKHTPKQYYTGSFEDEGIRSEQQYQQESYS